MVGWDSAGKKARRQWEVLEHGLGFNFDTFKFPFVVISGIQVKFFISLKARKELEMII